MTSASLLQAALDAARAAADVHRRQLGAVRVEDWSEKGSSDFVTHVDREAEARVLEHIGARFPDHEIMAEESAQDTAARAVRSSEWLWVVDPLDGTTNFLHGYPMYAASVAVLHHGEPVAGAVVCAATGEEWTATRGGGAFRNGERVRVSTIDTLDRALIGTGFPFKALDLLPAYLRQFDRVLRGTSGVRRGGSAALDLCHVASGYLDGFWELVLQPWDIAAGVLLIREAGGRITTLEGHDDLLTGAPVAVLAGNPAIHARLSERLRSDDAD